MKEKPMRILVAGPGANLGGIEAQVHAWWMELKEKIHFDYLMIGPNEMAYEKEYLEGGSRVYHIPERKKHLLASRRTIVEVLKKGNYDYLHFHMMSYSWADPMLAAEETKTKLVLHSHITVLPGSLSRKTALLHQLGKKKTQKIPTIYLACGEEAGRTMFGHDRFTVLENGIDTGRFSFSEEKRNRVRQEYGILPEEKLIGHIGRPFPQKNYPFLLRSFAELRKIRKDVRLMLIGNVAGDENILLLIRKLQLESSVSFTGPKNPVDAYYSAMDLFYLPSLFEGLPVTLIEAQAAGLCCVASSFVSKESNAGGLVSFIPVEDPKAAAAVLDQKLGENHTRENCLPKSYDIRCSAEKLRRLYEENRR